MNLLIVKKKIVDQAFGILICPFHTNKLKRIRSTC